MAAEKVPGYFSFMPRDNGRDVGQRRRRILEAAQRCFLRKGLHGTSMNDVAEESGLSEDAVTAQFAGREDLVQAIAESIALAVAEFFEAVLGERPVPPLDEVVERFAGWAVEFGGPDRPGRLAPIFWASALYNETMAERARTPIERSRSGWIEVVERARADGGLPAGTDPRAVGTVLACLLPGILLQRQLLEGIDAETVRRGVSSLGTGASTPR
jgi:AcrR family transcriptional regulator